jgi:hypothetical protein
MASIDSESNVCPVIVALIQRVRANDSTLTSIGVPGEPRDQWDLDWTEAEHSSLSSALHNNTHLSKLRLVGQDKPWSPQVMQLFGGMLASNRSITELTLCWCDVDGSLLADGLKQHTMLKALALHNLEVPVKGMQMIIRALLECPALQTLALRGQMTAPAAMPEMIVLLRHSRSLLTLELRECGLHGAPLRLLADDLLANGHLRELDLMRMHSMTRMRVASPRS